MANRIRNSLSAKIFLGIALILLTVCLLMFGILRIFMPKTYENEFTAQLTENIQILSEQMQTSPSEQWDYALASFCIENNANVSILDENKEQVSGFFISVYTVVDDIVITNASEESTAEITVESENNSYISVTAPFEYNDELYSIVVYANTDVVDQVTKIFTKISPYVIISIFFISALAAFFYSRFLAKPIVDISNVSKKMTALDMAWRCDISRSDEIGVLAGNLNEMAERLDSTLKELQTANEKLQEDINREREQERRRRDFFSAISHELKTPVTILKGELDGMILNVGKFKDRDKYLQEAYETTESIEKLVREIMALAKLDTLCLKQEDVTLSGLADECCRMYEVMAQNKHIQISRHYDAGIIIQADKKLLRTALSNIIGNAVCHSPESSTIDIAISKKDDKGILSVENSGIHIGTAELLQIWEPFYRTDKSRSRDTGGSGLGLYIVKTILDLHGFMYQLENTDVGMRFTIIFPFRTNE